jgi:hypothetical protein
MSQNKFFSPDARSKEIRNEVLLAEHTDFGIADDRGRALGCSFTVREVEYAAKSAEECASSGYRQIAPGVYYTASSCATRNGNGFGAYHYPTYHATREEAEKEGRRKVRASGKRYAKQFAKAAV